MTPADVMTMGQQALEVTMLISAPLLGAVLVTGLVVSVFQAATQINEQTLSFVPKIVAVFLAMLLFGPWLIRVMTVFTIGLFESFLTVHHPCEGNPSQFCNIR